MNLKHLEALMEQATPLPWAEGISSHHTVSKAPKFFDYRVAEFHHARDAELVDAAVNALPELIAALREAREALVLLREAHRATMRKHPPETTQAAEKIMDTIYRGAKATDEMIDKLKALEGE